MTQQNKLKEYQQPMLKEYYYFGVVVDGETTGGPEKTEWTCKPSGFDEN